MLAQNPKAANQKGNTTKTNALYISKDSDKYGKLVPQIYNPGDVCVSLSKILYGSSASKKTGKATAGRWVLNP